MQPVFLIGFMGCGKTTLGRALGKATRLEFIDLDTRIECRYRKSVAQIFAERGEAGFREIERRMLAEVADMTDVVVACGGGTPCFFDNMELMNSRGLTVRLDASPDTLLRRLMAGRVRRPLLAGKTDDELAAFIADTQERRRQHYSKAMASFASDLLESAGQIDKSVRLFAETFNIPLRDD